jgi:hypothetical protein
VAAAPPRREPVPEPAETPSVPLLPSQAAAVDAGLAAAAAAREHERVGH